jgi:phosphate transport system substrate-binding protein
MWPVGVSTEGNEGIASEVKVTAGAIGYAELAYARENRLSVAAIRDQHGEFRLPGGSEDKYPITTRTWLVFDPERLSAEKGEALTAFIRWALQDGAAIAHDYEYRALEPDTVARYDSLLTGTDFKSCERRRTVDSRQ